MSSSPLLTVYVVAAVFELGGIFLGWVELSRAISRTRARLGHSNPWDDHGQGAYDAVAGVKALRLAAVLLFCGGVALGFFGNVMSAVAFGS